MSKKYEKTWTMEDLPLTMVEMVWFGDVVKRGEILAHSFNNHYFISENQKVTFFMDIKTKKYVAKKGEKIYSNLKLLNDFTKNIKKIKEQNIKFNRKIDKLNFKKTNNKELFNYYSRFYNNYSSLLGIYRCIRPENYELALKKLAKDFPAPKNKNIEYILSKNFDKLNFNLNSDIKNTFLKIIEIGEERLRMHKIWLNSFLKARKIYREIAKRNSLNYLQIVNCTYSEVSNLLLKNILPDINKVNKRINYYKFVYNKSNFNIKITKPKPKVKNNPKLNLIRGKTTFPGNVKGKVKIIPHHVGRAFNNEIKKMKKGQVIVTVSTSLDYMPAIRKSGAIITNTGGVLSHAAVISRELKIPCIVGTKIATEVLKDGDLVEVDANKGIVRKI